MNIDRTKFDMQETMFETDSNRDCVAMALNHFTAREHFINHTGVFVNGVGYDIAARRFRSSGKTLPEFLASYSDVYKDTIKQTASGTKYEGIDLLVKNGEKLTDMELMYLLTVEQEHWEDRALSLEEILDEMEEE